MTSSYKNLRYGLRAPGKGGFDDNSKVNFVFFFHTDML